MEKIRLSVWIALAALLYFCFFTWQQDYPEKPATQPAPTAAPVASALPALPGETAKPAVQPAVAPQPIAAAPSESQSIAHIVVRTDVLDLDISLRGGELTRADLVKYSVSHDKDAPHIRLLDSAAADFYTLRSGLLAAEGKKSPTHEAIFSSPATTYELGANQDTLSVPLTWTDEQGVTVTKTYTLKRGSYSIGLEYEVANRSDVPLQVASYVQIARHQPHLEQSMFNAETYAFMGPAVFDGKSIKNLKLDKEENKHFTATYTGGWLATMQHHFVAAAVPTADQAYDFKVDVESPQQFAAAYRGPLVAVASGATAKLQEKFFIGPKLQKQLEATATKLDLTADYGLLTTIASPLFFILQKVNDLIGNWGWSIIIVTLLIKLVFYKLTETSGKSMAKMRELAPRMKQLQERYKDDREQLGRATMEFYKREKINPLAGCLPTLVQMPVFMAFYWAILNSAEMRQAPFVGYLTDLSSRDPYFILPVILGVVNFLQFRLNPQPADPVQAKVMMFMPIVMTGMMVMFPSGLVLYWITNTGLSILQQWHINRVVAAASSKNKA